MAAALMCPHCGKAMPGYDWRRYDRIRRSGRCMDCERPADGTHVRCATCRAKRARRMAQKRAMA